MSSKYTPSRLPIEDRLKRDALIDANGCHIWQRATNNRGYGVTYWNGKLHLAHRVAWTLANDRSPNPELVLDHICEVRTCINPDHLRELPNHLNLRRAHEQGSVDQEHSRAMWRKANAKRRGNYRYTEGG